jgi:hypothetical protein
MSGDGFRHVQLGSLDRRRKDGEHAGADEL